MIHIVIFSFNRAIQLDYLLKSIYKRFISTDYTISIIYHTSTNMHKESYEKLRNDYLKYKSISFLEREKQIFNLKSALTALKSFTNFKLFVKNSYLFSRNGDNFKSLLENTLKITECEYVMFNTDDGYFFEDVVFSSEILNLIKSKPFDTSYRLYVGENLNEFPSYLNKIENKYYSWNYFEQKKITHWTYPFSVDGTVYHTKSLLSIIKKVYYHNPITLEGNVVRYVIKKKYFKTGLGPIISNLIGTKLNRVSTDSLNPTININTDYLSEKYLDGYELELELPQNITNANIVPNKVFLIKGNEKYMIYSINEDGICVQNSLGIEGAKLFVK